MIAATIKIIGIISFNRTIEELKYDCRYNQDNWHNSFNRTIEELKFIECLSRRRISTPF